MAPVQLTQDGIDELRERVEPHIAHPDSDEGREVINDADAHVVEVWEDGELTTTKSHNGELYRHRSLHQMERPVWPEGAEILFDVPDDKDHQRMVVTDREALKEILDEHR